MAYEIGVGPAQLTINVGDSVLITEVDGQIRHLLWSGIVPPGRAAAVARRLSGRSGRTTTG